MLGDVHVLYVVL